MAIRDEPSAYELDRAHVIRCRTCHRRVERVDGVGWLHVETRVYFVPALEPKCDVAEPR
jgi:hypothetical protein